MLLVKPIKPPKINVEAIARRLEAALAKEADLVARAYDRTVATWDNPPVFKPQRIQQNGDLIYRVVPTGNAEAVKHYQWTDLGTEPHTITAKNAPTLAFRTGFSAKTRARTIGSRQGSKSGPYARPLVVNHPGTTAREFTATILQRRISPMQKRLAEAARRRGR